MKTDHSVESPETRTVAVLAGLAIGLGLAVHEVFFLVAVAILLIRPIEEIARHEHLTHAQHRRFL